MRRRCEKTAVLIVVLAMAVMISACSMQPASTVTQENYDKLTMGMTLEAVTEILGLPPHHSKRFGVEEYTWTDGDRHIHAKFVAGRAIYYSSKGLEDTVQQSAVAKTGH